MSVTKLTNPRLYAAKTRGIKVAEFQSSRAATRHAIQTARRAALRLWKCFWGYALAHPTNAA